MAISGTGILNNIWLLSILHLGTFYGFRVMGLCIWFMVDTVLMLLTVKPTPQTLQSLELHLLMGSSENDGPILVALNIRCRTTIYSQKGFMILGTALTEIYACTINMETDGTSHYRVLLRGHTENRV